MTLDLLLFCRPALAIMSVTRAFARLWQASHKIEARRIPSLGRPDTSIHLPRHCSLTTNYNESLLPITHTSLPNDLCCPGTTSRPVRRKKQGNPPGQNPPSAAPHVFSKLQCRTNPNPVDPTQGNEAHRHQNATLVHHDDRPRRQSLSQLLC